MAIFRRGPLLTGASNAGWVAQITILDKQLTMMAAAMQTTTATVDSAVYRTAECHHAIISESMFITTIMVDQDKEKRT